MAPATREGSADDLQNDADVDWEWLYDSEEESGQPEEFASSGHSAENGSVNGDEGPSEGRHITPRKRKAVEAFLSASQHARRIDGARLGNAEYRVGDAVALKADRNEVWVALITEFVDDEDLDDEKAAKFMWLSSPKEIYNKAKRRNDILPNELYITTSTDENSLNTIDGPATICSPEAFFAKYPSGKVPRKDPDYGRIFVCRMGASLRTATYTSPFTWEDTYSGAQDLDALRTLIDTETKATRKKQSGADDRTRDLADLVVRDGAADDDYDETNPRTPRKKQKTKDATTPKSTPRRQRQYSQFTTPTHRRIIAKKPLDFTPLGTRMLQHPTPSSAYTASPTHKDATPHALARTRLHVSSVPAALPCREDEFATVYTSLESAITDGTGSCIYISGTPGTGKTATVREVVAQLHASVAAEELNDFVFVEINGMRLTEPSHAYSLLWEAVTGGERVAPTAALGLLSREFAAPSPRRVPVVVLMDELDQLVTKSQSVMYNFFNWPSLPHSRLIVLAVANTMDLPERTLSNKISSRLGLSRITFQGYTHQQLMKIIETRLEGLDSQRADGERPFIDSDAIQFASRKVAQVSGDARRALDICRRAVEIAELEVDEFNNKENQPSNVLDADDWSEVNAKDLDIPDPDTPSRRHRSRPPQTSGTEVNTKGRVTIPTIQRAIREATFSPLSAYLKSSISLGGKVLLSAMLARMRRGGVGECDVGDCIDEASRILKTSEREDLGVLLATALDVTGKRREGAASSKAGKCCKGEKGRKKGKGMGLMKPRVSGLEYVMLQLSEAGVVVWEMGKGMRGGRVRLLVGEEEIKDALKDDEEGWGLGFR